MSIQVEFQATAPPLRWDEAGGIRIGQSRVTLDSLLAAYQIGSTPEEIALQYDVLSLSEIYATIAYYLTHRQQIDNYLEQRRQNAQQYRQKLTQDNNLVNLRERLLARHQSQVSWYQMRLVTDENFNGAILRGLIRRLPELDVVRVQDVGLMHTDDATILEWAANEERILLTHDVATIVMYAGDRINQGLPMPGVVEVIATAPIGQILDDLELFILCSQPGEYEDQIIFIPFSWSTN